MQTSELATARLSPQDRRRIRDYAVTSGQMAFFHVVPSESGLTRTIWVSQNEAYPAWVSQNEAYPALLVNPAAGRVVEPAQDVVVVGFDETTPFGDVNEWLARDRTRLPALARQEIDVADFYDAMWQCPT